MSEDARIGLVNHCVPAAEVLAKARAIALELADGPTWAIRWTTFATADHPKATRSVKDKRKPKFGAS